MAQENARPLASQDSGETCVSVTPPDRNRLPGIISNAILIEVGWAACVFGAAYSFPLVGPGVVAVLLAIHWGVNKPCYGELSLMGIVTLLGFGIDSVLSATDFFRFHGATLTLAPLWLVALWLNLATAINWSLAWLKGRLWLQSLFGALVGPFAYYMGTRLGALEFPRPIDLTLLVLAIVWGITLPLVYLLNDALMGRLGREALILHGNR